MRATVELAESIYRRSQQAARARGVSMDEFISDALEQELGVDADDVPAVRKQVTFPLIHSKEPGTMDLSDFNFDDLLA